MAFSARYCCNLIIVVILFACVIILMVMLDGKKSPNSGPPMKVAPAVLKRWFLRQRINKYKSLKRFGPEAKAFFRNGLARSDGFRYQLPIQRVSDSKPNEDTFSDVQEKETFKENKFSENYGDKLRTTKKPSIFDVQERKPNNEDKFSNKYKDRPSANEDSGMSEKRTRYETHGAVSDSTRTLGGSRDKQNEGIKTGEKETKWGATGASTHFDKTLAQQDFRKRNRTRLSKSGRMPGYNRILGSPFGRRSPGGTFRKSERGFGEQRRQLGTYQKKDRFSGERTPGRSQFRQGSSMQRGSNYPAGAGRKTSNRMPGKSQWFSRTSSRDGLPGRQVGSGFRRRSTDGTRTENKQ